MAALTKYHKFLWLIPTETCALTALEARCPSQGVSRVLLPPKPLGEEPPLPRPKVSPLGSTPSHWIKGPRTQVRPLHTSLQGPYCQLNSELLRVRTSTSWGWGTTQPTSPSLSSHLLKDAASRLQKAVFSLKLMCKRMQILMGNGFQS